MPPPVSAVGPDTARVTSQTDTTTYLRQKAKGSWMYFFFFFNLIFTTVEKGLLLCSDDRNLSATLESGHYPALTVG